MSEAERELGISIQEFKQKLIDRINQEVAPHLVDRSFLLGNNKYQFENMRIWAPNEVWSFSGQFVLNQMVGITEQGVLADNNEGGLRVIKLESCPLEDLIALDDWVTKTVDAKADKAACKGLTP